ncbi:splicing factor 3B subunit 1 [Drosophila innubila]|uniref:splicing factor 3B subunit 1 n=1 Tax=Drosophila innubila TaxID=198719 RepID=UPI00148C081D|nr:splicing factor 3B subunit 1 [Drosophila innubila]
MENIPRTHEDIEAQISDIQAKKTELAKTNAAAAGVGLLDSGGFFDSDLYDDEGAGGKGKGAKGRYEGYNTSIAANDDEGDEDEEEEDDGFPVPQKRTTYTAPTSVLKDVIQGKEDVDPMADRRRPTIADREDEYRQKRRRIIISPDRADPFADGGKTPDVGSRTYTDIMREQMLKGEESELRRRIMEKSKDGTLVKSASSANGESAAKSEGGRKRGRWDQTVSESFIPAKVAATPSSAATPTWEDKTPGDHRWDETPGHKGSETPGATPGLGTRIWDATPAHAMTPGHETPGHEKSARRNRWDETPKTERETPGHSGWAETPKPDRSGSGASGESISIESTPGASKRRSRWDETPSNATPSITPSNSNAMTPSMTPHATPGHATPLLTPGGSTPVGIKAMAMATPTPGALAAMTPEQLQAYRWEKEIDERNRPYTDEELDQIFPPGYKILPPPAGYVPLRTPGRKLMATPTPIAGTPAGFFIQLEDKNAKFMDNQPKGQNLPFMKPEDAQYFDKLLVDVNEDALSPEELKERKIMKLLLTIKNGSPPMRKSALRQMTDKAREFGAGPLFNQILPLLMSPTLEDQERHLLVKVIDRVLYKLDDLVRPFVHKILVVIEPLLIDEDYYARIEGREIISNLAKAAGLATMISTMRPDIDNIDEYVRNTTARAFAVVASALGIPSLLPFLKAVCKSKKSWQARHTGIKIVQQIAILMGCAILPHLKALVEIIEHGLVDEQQKVRTITALAIAALAEAATPYGIESFDSVLKPLWKGIRTHRGKGLAAFLKAIGYLIPLMDAEYANYYTREVMLILIREFQSPDEEMKKIVLKVVKQCCATDGVEPQYIKEEILPHFFKFFWNHRMALDRRNYRQLVDTTVEIANKVGTSEIINRVVDDLKDENEQYRKMVMETVEKIMGNLGAADIDSRLEEQLIDGILYAFQEQTTEDVVMLNGFGTIVNQLGKRVKPYLPQICGTILWRLNNKSAKVRQQAADLISRIAVVMKTCQEEKLMGHLGVVLYEYLGEEYPEVLGSILGALKAIVNVIGMTKMTPPIKDLLPRLTPILKNRHEKVQENCIDLVGRIADRGPEYVSAREWMRICFELLELLKAHKKAIRRATVNTFGYIAKAIGPHDVLATLLNNLKVQERQNRVCTTVAIAIVAETCRPFTVLPALMNEYRVPELNVQNGVLKSLSFLFEYIGEMGKDYIYAVCPLLEDALMDRDLVHRQTACSAIKHMSLGVYGFGCEDALTHLLNYVWPNIFETSPHLVQAFMDSVDGLRVSLGSIKILQYTLQGLFHPARKVRDVYWKIYNSLYIGGQDALIAGYPRITNDPKNQYERYELDYML